MYAVGGAQAAVLHFNGSKWTIKQAGYTYNDVHGNTDADAYLVTGAGMARRLAAPVQCMEKLPTNEVLYGVWVAPTGDVYIVGNKGVILHGK